MSSFASQIGSAVGAVLEFDAPGDEFGDTVWSGLDNMLYGIQVAEAIAGR